jgi:hypothetical protein
MTNSLLEWCYRDKTRETVSVKNTKLPARSWLVKLNAPDVSKTFLWHSLFQLNAKGKIMNRLYNRIDAEEDMTDEEKREAYFAEQGEHDAMEDDISDHAFSGNVGYGEY